MVSTCADNVEEMLVNLDARTCSIQSSNLATIPGVEGQHLFILSTTDMDREACCAATLTPASYLDVTRPICYNAEENTPQLTSDFLLNVLKEADPAVGSSVSVRLEAESNLASDQYTYEIQILPGSCRDSFESDCAIFLDKDKEDEGIVEIQNSEEIWISHASLIIQEQGSATQ